MCEADIAKEQLMYSMELFADRNQVNQHTFFLIDGAGEHIVINAQLFQLFRQTV